MLGLDWGEGGLQWLFYDEVIYCVVSKSLADMCISPSSLSLFALCTYITT